MNNGRLHADHIDETGAYSKRFEVVRELVANGTLTEVPREFSITEENDDNVTVASSTNTKFNFYDEFGQKHADHVDETGEYKRAWEAAFGPLDENNEVNNEVNTEWKSFLQQLIAEEKAKLNI